MNKLYLSLELSSKKWKLGWSCLESRRMKTTDIDSGDWAAFDASKEAAISTFNLTDPRIISCYEAGRDGFWIHRGLETRGLVNLVIDSASIEVDRRKRHAKTDSIDLKSMNTLLKRHDNDADDFTFRIAQVAQVPTRKDEDDRQLHRQLEASKKRRTSLSNTIKALLVGQGVKLDILSGLGKSIDTMLNGNGKPLGQVLKARLKADYAQYELVDQQINQLHKLQEKQTKEAATTKTAMVKQFTNLRGIGTKSAWILVMEVFGWRSFQNRRQAGSYTGLTPTPWASGDLSREQGISKAGNARIRWLMVELSWLWVRWQPQSKLSKWFKERTEHSGKRMRRLSIVALARKLFIALWRYITQGVVPQGATLTPA